MCCLRLFKPIFNWDLLLVHIDKYPMKLQGKIRQIFIDHFETYLELAYKSQQQSEKPVKDNNALLPNGKKKHKKKTKKKIIRIRPVELENIYKILFCRTGLLGYHWYVCPLSCGFELLVPHSCKSRFCSCCGYIATDNWINTRFNFLLDCHYQHIVVTVPATYNWMIKLDRKSVLNFYLHCATDTIQEWAKSRGVKVAMVSFYHSFGGRLQFHPHFHIIVTSGGIDQAGHWQHIYSAFPAEKLMEKFKVKFVSGLKDLFKTEQLKTKANLNRVLYQIEYPFSNHWQFYVERITKSGRSTMKYCVRYAKKMIISEQRIWKYDGKQVWYLCSKKENGKKKKYIQKEAATIFIGKVVQHIPEKYFKLIRYFGFYVNNKYTKEMYEQALRYFNPLDANSEKDNWQKRQWKRDGKDPLLCPNCNCSLVLKQVTFTSYHLL